MSDANNTPGWVLHGAGRDFGPLSTDELRGYFRAGMVRPADVITAPGSTMARSAAEVAGELGETLSSAPPPLPSAATLPPRHAAPEAPRSRLGFLLVVLAIVGLGAIGINFLHRHGSYSSHSFSSEEEKAEYNRQFDRAERLLAREDWPGLVAHAQAWHLAQPRFSDPFRFLAIAHSEMEHWNAAVQASKDELALEPLDRRVAERLLANSLARAGRYGEAEVLLKRLLSENPDDAQALSPYAVVLHHAGHHDAELLALQKAVRLDPSLKYAWGNLGRAYQEHSDETRAAQARERSR